MYALKPILSRNMVHFIPITKSEPTLSVGYYFTTLTDLMSSSPCDKSQVVKKVKICQTKIFDKTQVLTKLNL